jgi:isopentenyl diphosphate isomerase/L-lactate dehydrogenase-like FMN-dependent dehydrogenase
MTIDRRAAIAGAAAALSVSGAASRALAQAIPAGLPTDNRPLKFVAVEDLAPLAAKALGPGPYAFMAGGQGDEWTLRENREAFHHFAIEPHYLAGNPPQPDTRITILGSQLAAPIMTAPVGGQGLFHARADLATAEGTKAAGHLMICSTAATATLEQIAAASGPKWFQLYLPDDRGVAASLLQRARAAGYTAVTFTIDTLGAGNSDELQRSGFQSQAALQAAAARVTAGAPGAGAPRGQSKRNLGWDDVEFVQKASGLPVLLKGVLSPGLAKQAIQRGCAGVQVSNHGGRQMDGVHATIDVLGPIADAVAGKGVIVMDSGVRRGSDIFKALALGADCVAIGRAAMYGLALGGALGVQSVHEKLRDELVATMRASGAATIKDIDRSFVSRA